MCVSVSVWVRLKNQKACILGDCQSLVVHFLTLSTALAFVADGAHTVAIGACAVAAAKRVNALRDWDVTLGSFPAAVTHTGAFVVLAVAAAQHGARRWRNRGEAKGRRSTVHTATTTTTPENNGFCSDTTHVHTYSKPTNTPPRR